MAKESASGRPRLLFAVAEGEYYARHCMAVADSLPDFECLFLGYSWSNGHLLRKAGKTYRYLAWRAEAPCNPTPIPPVSEFKRHRHRPQETPECTWKAYHALNSMVSEEIAKFNPDLVLYFDIEHAICHLVDQAAMTRRIPRLGLQPWMRAGQFILHREGIYWQEELQKEIQTRELESISELGPPPVSNSPSSSLLKPTLLLRGCEAILRLLTRATSFYDLEGLSSRVTAKLLPRPWFRGHRTLQSLDQVYPGFVLVTLHQPILPSDFPTWIHTLEYALLATPLDWPLVIRPHPKEASEEVPWPLERELQQRNIWISRAGSGPLLKDLIPHAKALVTTTSMTGFEGLLSGVPVLTLGPAFFARQGLARWTGLAEAAHIHDLLVSGALPCPDQEIVRKFHLWMKQTRVVTIDPNQPETLQPVANRLRVLASGASSDEPCGH